jgi:hypothetical protein
VSVVERRAVALVIVCLVAVIVALVAAWISSTNGSKVAVAVRDGGIAFAGTVGLGMTVLGAGHVLD